MQVLKSIAVEPAVKQAIAARGIAGERYNTVLKRILNIENIQDPKDVNGKIQKNSKGEVVNQPRRPASLTPEQESGNVIP